MDPTIKLSESNSWNRGTILYRENNNADGVDPSLKDHGGASVYVRNSKALTYSIEEDSNFA